jgi:hypothetical protein
MNFEVPARMNTDKEIILSTTFGDWLPMNNCTGSDYEILTIDLGPVEEQRYILALKEEAKKNPALLPALNAAIERRKARQCYRRQRESLVQTSAAS